MQFNSADSIENSKNSLNNWLKLYLTPGFGVKTCLNIWQKYPNLEDFFENWHSLKLPDKAKKWLEKPDNKLIDQQLNWLDLSENNHLITIESANYPKALAQISNPPILLYIKGNLKQLNLPQLAIVGSRNPSSQGIKITRHFAAKLSEAGWLITSGLASGIDSAAHLGAIDAKKSTLAVMGTGINKIYPDKNKNLANQILETGGCLITEFALNAPANAFHFPQRNRIIAALSLATVVTEAGLKSGSLITAELANEFGREVFALPGYIEDPRAEGSNQLISQGAQIITSIHQLTQTLELAFSHIKFMKSTQTTHKKTKLNENNHPLLKIIDYHPKSVDEIVFESKIPVAEIQGELSILEIEGFIQYLPDGQIVKKHDF